MNLKVTLFFLSFFVLVAAYAIPVFVRAEGIVPGAVIAVTNAERAKHSLAPLTVHPLLMKAAQAKADDLVKNQYFGHVSPSGKTPWYWFKQVGYSYTAAGENLAKGFPTAERTVTGWMNSIGHRANLLNNQFTQVGVGVARKRILGKDSTIVVELYGKPRK